MEDPSCEVLKWVLGLVALLVVVFVGGAFLLPREVTVARSIQVDAAPDAVFEHVNSLQATEKWSPWIARDPDMQISYSGPEAGVGAKSEWVSESEGNGSQEITASDPGKRVETALDFGDMGTAKAAFILSGSEAATDVTWTMVADMGNNPVGRWMGLMMDGMVGADYEAGLSNLKTLVETR